MSQGSYCISTPWDAWVLHSRSDYSDSSPLSLQRALVVHGRVDIRAQDLKYNIRWIFSEVGFPISMVQWIIRNLNLHSYYFFRVQNHKHCESHWRSELDPYVKRETYYQNRGLNVGAGIIDRYIIHLWIMGRDSILLKLHLLLVRLNEEYNE